MTTITLPNSIEIIENNCFYNSKLITITIPKSVKIIENEAFIWCANLVNVTLLGPLDSIGKEAFFYCKNLEFIIFPNSPMIVNNGVFIFKSPKLQLSFTHKTLFSYSPIETIANVSVSYLNASNLIITEDLFIMDSEQTEIYEYWRYRYYTITIPKSVIKIREKAFDNSTILGLKYEENSTLTYIGNYAFRDCSSLKKIEIPSSIIMISDYAFINCTKLEIIKFSKSNKLENFSILSISNCVSLKNISDFSSSKYSCEYNTIYYKNDSKIHPIHHVSKSIDKVLVINCNVICSYSFNISLNIENISISSNSVTLIKKCSFIKCANLKYINFPLSVETVEEFAFYECKSIQCPLIIGNKSIDYIGMIANSGIDKNLIKSCNAIRSSPANPRIRIYKLSHFRRR